MMKPGSIVKVAVRNFVTYSYAELHPGPKLNLILGPNGTGKSTMVAAIILGLGGSPKVVGRGSQVSEYVKHGSEEATIEVTLQSNVVNETDVITRQFDLQNHTTWQINGRKVNSTQITHLTASYNIQVDNLCQFLPQDRVQEFAQLNKQVLLEKTLEALCKTDLIKLRSNLIKSRERHRVLLALVDKESKKLDELKSANVRLECRVESYKKRNKYISNLKVISRKIAWVNFELLQKRREEVKSDKNVALKVYENYKKEVKPIESELAKSKSRVTFLKNQIREGEDALAKIESTHKSHREKKKKLVNDIKNIEDERDSELMSLESSEDEVVSMKNKMEHLLQNKNEVLSKFGSDQQVREMITQKENELKKLKDAIQSIETSKNRIVNEKYERLNEIRMLESEARLIRNIEQKRLDLLRRTSDDAYKATIWLKDNRHLFEGQIFNPIMMEINVINTNNSCYLENIVSTRDLVAFTCTSKEDMNRFTQIARVDNGFNINVVYSSENESYRPSVPIEQLKQFGFYSYVDSLFEAPKAIKNYLCRSYGVHNIPIGTYATNDCTDRIPDSIRLFFSDKFRFSTKFSKYSDAKSISQQEISSNGRLSVSVDSAKLDEISANIKEIQKEISKTEEQLNKSSMKVNNLRDVILKIQTEIKTVRNSREQVRNLEQRIAGIKTNLEKIERNRSTVDDINKKANEKINAIIEKMVQKEVELKNCFKSYSHLLIEHNLKEISLRVVLKRITYLENNMENNGEKLRESLGAFNRIKEIYENIVEETRTAWQKAKSLSNGFTPDEEGFDEFREDFEKLGDDLDQLEAKKEQIQMKIDSVHAASNGEVVEFEERLTKISMLENELEAHNNELSELEKFIEKTKNNWLTPLNKLVKDIDLRFGRCYEKMKCAGEVSLYIGPNEKDFEEYGLNMQVSYRSGQPLQQLNSTTQSGGERAVATAVYMLSLQDMTPVPFRCVDEINQGMDENNERRIFDLLTELTNQEDTSQYFLVSPKLIKDLKYSATTKVHIIFNGPFVCDQETLNSAKSPLNNK